MTPRRARYILAVIKPRSQSTTPGGPANICSSTRNLLSPHPPPPEGEAGRGAGRLPSAGPAVAGSAGEARRGDRRAAGRPRGTGGGGRPAPAPLGEEPRRRRARFGPELAGTPTPPAASSPGSARQPRASAASALPPFAAPAASEARSGSRSRAGRSAMPLPSEPAAARQPRARHNGPGPGGAPGPGPTAGLPRPCGLAGPRTAEVVGGSWQPEREQCAAASFAVSRAGARLSKNMGGRPRGTPWI